MLGFWLTFCSTSFSNSITALYSLRAVFASTAFRRFGLSIVITVMPWMGLVMWTEFSRSPDMIVSFFECIDVTVQQIATAVHRMMLQGES